LLTPRFATPDGDFRRFAAERAIATAAMLMPDIQRALIFLLLFFLSRYLPLLLRPFSRLPATTSFRYFRHDYADAQSAAR